MLLGRLAVTVGLVCMLHAAYGASHYRSFLKLGGEEFTGLPLDIAAECLFGLLLTLVAVVAMKSDFQNIHWLKQFAAESWDQAAARPSLRIYHGSRSRAIFE